MRNLRISVFLALLTITLLVLGRLAPSDDLAISIPIELTR
jgi:hypothetical protein